MDNQVNYKPFSALADGSIFTTTERLDVSLMKAGGTFGVLLNGFWEGDILHPRGKLITFSKSECVVLATEGELSLPMAKVDPIDPRRRFWKDGDTAWVGDRSRATVNVFAGLFLYAGMGCGTYYSAVENEVFHMDAAAAREKARAEDIPFLRYDSFHWTNDPTLARERQQAKEDFDNAKRRQAERAETADAV